jgi:hypothetical protein
MKFRKKKYLLASAVLAVLGIAGCASLPKNKDIRVLPEKPANTMTVSKFYTTAFQKERKALEKYSYLYFGDSVPQDKIYLGPITSDNKLIPKNFDYYIDLKQTLGNYLNLLVGNVKNYDEFVTGSVIVESLGEVGGGMEGDLESTKGVKGTAVMQQKALATTKRIMMTLTMLGTDNNGNERVDSSVQNVITYRERENTVNLAVSFLTFSVGMNKNRTEKDSIIQTLKALSDFSLIQLIAKNYAVPFWYLYGGENIRMNDDLRVAQNAIFEKYKTRFPSYEKIQSRFAPGMLIRNALIYLYGADARKLKHEPVYTLNKGNPLYRFYVNLEKRCQKIQEELENPTPENANLNKKEGKKVSRKVKKGGKEKYVVMCEYNKEGVLVPADNYLVFNDEFWTKDKYAKKWYENWEKKVPDLKQLKISKLREIITMEKDKKAVNAPLALGLGIWKQDKTQLATDLQFNDYEEKLLRKIANHLVQDNILYAYDLQLSLYNREKNPGRTGQLRNVNQSSSNEYSNKTLFGLLMNLVNGGNNSSSNVGGTPNAPISTKPRFTFRAYPADQTYKINNQKHAYIILSPELHQKLALLATYPNLNGLSDEQKKELIALILTATNPLVTPETYQKLWHLGR